MTDARITYTRIPGIGAYEQIEYEVRLDGVLIGTAFRRRTHSYVVHRRIRRDLGHPIRWGFAPVGESTSGKRVGFDTRRAAVAVYLDRIEREATA